MLFGAGVVISYRGASGIVCTHLTCEGQKVIIYLFIYLFIYTFIHITVLDIINKRWKDY